MALLNPTFIFGVIVLAYFSSFIIFAILRILTGISIQRIGYFSLRRLAYTPKDGIKIQIRGLGVNLHRPTFAQPTWVSIVLTELAVTVDLKAADGEKSEGPEEAVEGDDGPVCDFEPKKEPLSRRTSFGPPRSKSWERLMGIKERIKRLHCNINWIRLVDVVATNCSVAVVDVGQIEVGSFTVAVDTRRKMVDRGRMFTHLKSPKKEQRPAEWMITVRSVLFTPEGGDSLEVLDHATLNIHGLLYKELDGLRDAAISVKLGRVHIPYDDINTCINRYKGCRRLYVQETPDEEISVQDLIEELDRPGSREEKLVQTVSDSKEFASSILRGIKEVQFAVSFVGFTTQIKAVKPHGTPIYLNASMKEVGVDLHRLDQKSPAHRMYFSSKDVAHQALVAALAISIGVDDGNGKPERLVYIPMATTTVRTTLPSKTVEFVEDNSAAERNANILFANVVITSPSIDLDPKHLPLVLAMLHSKPKTRDSNHPQKHVVISRLLPKANVKFSMHEPVIRIALPPVEKSAAEDDFDLIISSISSVSLDIESSHSAVGELHYSLGSTFRVQSHDLYYQTSSGAHFDLLQTESLELKVQLNANPEVHVVATGNLQTFSIHMIRPEISDGVRQIVRQLRLNVEPTKKTHAKTARDPNFVRALPPWLLHFQLSGSDFSAEVAGVDEDISDDTRGVALQLQSWTADYKALKVDSLEKKTSRRRTWSRSLTPDPEVFLNMPISPRKKQQQHPTDGRRLAVHVRGLEAFIVESTEKWEHEPFVAMPRFEVALSTSSDAQGPVFHVNSHVRQLLVQYSLYRHYAAGVATKVLRKAFVRTKADRDEEQSRASTREVYDSDLLSPLMSPEDFYTRDAPEYPFTAGELVTVDFRATLVQVKAQMPSDPAVMLQIYGMEAGRHRWSPPFLHSKLARMYAEAPRMKHVWARLISAKGLRVDMRESRRKRSTGETVDEKLIDVNAEAIRLAIPHQLVLHKVFDNFVNTLKSVQQLHHRFATGTNEYILNKSPEGPKKLPKISIRSRALLFELEDGAFEWKLGTIYRTGLVEQAQRIARDAAFRVKAKKIEDEEMRKDSSRLRNRSAHPRGRSTHKDAYAPKRSKSEDSHNHEAHNSRSERGRALRYDPEGTCGMSSSAKISIGEAHKKLQRHNAQSWKRRIDRIYGLAKNGMKDIRGVFWGPDQLPDDMEDVENILEVPQRPALMATLISDLHITIEQPSFPMHQLPDFIYSVGKGMPYDMEYSLLIPMHVQIDMGEARITLRDYPLPLLHVPAIKQGQSPRLPAWSLKSDFVIAEEFRGPESTRRVKVDIVPAKKCQAGGTRTGGFAIDVRRTVSPVKSYSDIKVDINTGFPTRITWGASYQPAIQDMMMVIETFTKPQVDPSDRTGFWDKIRLSFHSRVSVAWKGDGDVHLMLKGTRDPYVVTGNGAGFLMCWRNDVRWNICRDEDPRKFMTVDSGEYILAIPDFSHQARNESKLGRDSDSMTSFDSFKRGAAFKKVVMKLSGNVQWLVGLMFERNLNQEGKRSFDFEPHYNVILKEAQFAKAPPGEVYDAFRGFRSHHIHMSIAVKAPVEREWSVSNMEKSNSYNTVHLTPRFFSHFFAWWSMFNGTMSLPIRQGALWPGIEKSSKKFGRHLATIKYNLLLAPLFISHIYKHKDAEDHSADVVSATGLKMRLDSFMLDMHQRREEFPTHDKGRKTQGKTTAMKMHQAQLDLLSADIRAITASIAGTTPEDLQKASAPTLVSQQDTPTTDLSNFEIPDNDFSWIDMDDFVELDWILPSEANPETKIMPLAYAPRFTYFRQTDHGDTISGDPDRTSPFGHEQTHFCIMSKDDDPRRVQCQLIQARLDQLGKQIESHGQAVGDAELACVRDDNNASLRADLEQLGRHGTFLHNKRLFLESMLHRMAQRIHTDKKRAVPDGDADVDSDGEKSCPKTYDAATEGMDTNPGADFISDFNNRFVIHNMQLKWNNLLRNIILRYIHQVSQRRGFVYYLSRRAVKFILDIVDEQNKAKVPKQTKTPETDASERSPSPEVRHCEPTSEDVEDRINELLADGRDFVNADDSQSPRKEPEKNQRVSADNLHTGIGREFAPQNSYHLRLIAPQIQLQSEKNSKAVVLVTAKGMEGKVVEVMDKDRLFDDVSGLVQRRFSVEMDSTQFFVTHQKWFSSQLIGMYSGNHYGVPAGSVWPPWVPMEVMFDFKIDPFGFKRIVQKTSATLIYEKYNPLRLKYNDEISSEGIHATAATNKVENRMDHLYVEFPKIFAICNSAQYYAMYIIVLDLLMYSEPLEKTRNERLEKIMLASDFSDLRGAPEMVIRLQERIRQLEELKTQFQINSKFLDKQGWEDRLALDRDLTSCEDELFFMMKAITSSQRKYDATQTSGLLRWIISSDQIVWHLIRDNNEPLMEFQLQNAEYDRVDNSDGSHANNMSIGKIIGLNLLPDAIYPEMFAPYSDAERGVFNEGENQQMLSVSWNMLEAIAGIPVMDRFEVNLFPMKIQLERDVGKRLFDYMFPGTNDTKTKSPFMVKHMQPVEDEDENEDSNTNGRRPSTVPGYKFDGDASRRAGSLELRLRPTMHSVAPPNTAVVRKGKASSLYSRDNNEGHHFRLFQSSSKNSSSSRGIATKTLGKKSSIESLQSSIISRPALGRSSTITSNMDSQSTNGDSKRFGMHRSSGKKEKPSDDLTQMMSRASEYMTLAHVKITSVVLCLSYKGKGERNIEDVHDFVFRLPEIEYRNKTWSNLDLALALKKDVIRALISHTGAIIGNKFSRHRPNAAQQHRLRELATSSMLLNPSSQDNSHDNSDASSSMFGTSPIARSDRSFASSNYRELDRTPSNSSSLHSMQSNGRSQIFPASLMMTPANKVQDRSESTLESERSPPKSTKSNDVGFVAATLGRLKKNQRESSPSIGGGQADDNEEIPRKKKGGLKGILGGLNQHSG
ncbi:related to FMP27 Found in Mitochondrial Proteome [Rhynchosporium agropyri]|uniref:Related to FMP27 Found in Mitochondrial Proteome n=1 Tax=Rhynchosporium agropyri TaxID=914238 RepID=A0A1E1KCE9_9HELO|nr:related to FMP27 Found in Mitochondrial Proteome [Rhynchosporium agropyri]